MIKFELVHQSTRSRARVGRIHTPHGIIETPNFVPVATNAAIKSLDSSITNQLNIQLMFCNTYHLLVHPGTDVIQQAGGLHTFMHRQGPLITDSGGFQVFSLAYGGVAQELKSKGTKKYDSAVLSITEEGVKFRSYRDGALINLTPESSVQAQKALGADIIIPLDELPPHHIDQQQLIKSLHRTHRWEARSLAYHQKDPKNQGMYGVIHGGIDPDLRTLSAKTLSKLDFDGFAIGGSLGKTRDQMIIMLNHLMPHIPTDRPNHLLGIGDLPSIAAGIPLGIDTFDSSHPTKCARHGLLFTKTGNVKIMQGAYKSFFGPIEKDCECLTCQKYTAAYVHHLFKSHEAAAHQLASIHNLYFMMQLMNDYRLKILENAL